MKNKPARPLKDLVMNIGMLPEDINNNMKSFKQYIKEERELPYNPEAIKRSEAHVMFPEITISEQELEDTIDDVGKRLPNGKSLLKRFTLAIVNVDGTYTLKQVPDHTMLAAENAERAGNTLELGGKEWDVVEVMKLYRKAPFPVDGSGKKFAGALIKVSEA